MPASRREFIRRHTRLRRPPAVSELQLYLADEIIPLWRRLDAEPGRKQESPPFWAFAWAGGQALARYLLDRPDEIRGKRVLDFAGGSGICALAAMTAGAAKATAVDIDPYSTEAVALNAAANRVAVTAWQCDLLDDGPPQVDVVLAGDVCYEAPMAGRVLPWLRNVQASGVRVLLADPGRDYFPEAEFRVLAEYDIPTPRDLEDAESKLTGVYAFRSAGPFITRAEALSG
jgi:predicted nicotinamide N-methyase